MKTIKNAKNTPIVKEVINALVVGTSLCLPPLGNGLTWVKMVS